MDKKIEVIGLGSGEIDDLPLGIYRKLKNNNHLIYARTKKHPVIDELQKEGIFFHSFDYLYEEETDFQKVYERIVNELIDQAKTSTVIYAVPGHPMLAEQTVQMLLKQDDIPIHLIGGQSYLDALFTALKIDPIDGFQFVDGTNFSREHLNFRQHLIFCQVYDPFIASHIKLVLLEDLPANYTVYIVHRVGTKQEMIQKAKLHELDHLFETSNLTTIYVPPVNDEQLLNHTFTNLRNIIKTLRGPNGCSWDQKQTHQSLRKYALEEVYELIDAINKEDDDLIVEELGDLLLQIMLHSQIGEDSGYFTINDVIKSISEKMIHRHPHVFSNDRKKQNKTWDELKAEETKTKDEPLLRRVLNHLPALQKAYDLQKEADKVGFNWESVKDGWEKYEEELKELNQAIKKDDMIEIEKEFGDVLFSLVNIALFYHVNPELALNRTNNKFISRFSYVEKKLKENKKDFKDVSLETMDQYWNQAKRKE